MPDPAPPTIALLGWGSLIWDHDPLFDAQHGDWQAGGPPLPLEFSRISAKRAKDQRSQNRVEPPADGP